MEETAGQAIARLHMTSTTRVLFRMRTVPFGWAGRQKPGSPERHGRLAVLTALLLSLNLPLGRAYAAGPEIITIPEIWVTPETEMPLVIMVQSRDPLPPRLMLLVRGLPPEVTLTEGRPFGQGVWVVPLASLARLRLRAPAQTSQNPLSLSLVTLEGTPLAETSVTLFVAQPPGKADQLPTAAMPLQDVPTIDREFGTKLMERGHDSIRAGNIAMARHFYQRAAERGLPEAAIALASTYDPRELGRLKVIGVQPDSALARKWYQRAHELGARDAQARLRTLP